MKRTQELKSHLQPGQVYRRHDLEQWSNSVDRHLQELVSEGTLQKLAGGMYLYPKQTAFGAAPATDNVLVERYLKDNRFLVLSYNEYNKLGVGTTQLYNMTVVYNAKRHGEVKLGNRTFNFVRKPYFPETVSVEFLLVDLVNNLEKLAEDSRAVLDKVKRKAASLDHQKLTEAVESYGGAKAKKFFFTFFATK